MAKPLTKEAFLEGKPFYKGNDETFSILLGNFYKLRTDKDEKPSHIVALESKLSDKWRHEANVQSLTDDCVILYRSICGQSVDKKIYFHEYNLVEEEPADAANN